MYSLSKTRVSLIALFVAAASIAPATRAFAQAAAGKVAVCDSLKAITSVNEYNDLKDQSTKELAGMNAEGEKLKAHLLDLQNQLKLLQPNSPQFNQLNQQLLTESIQADATMQMAQISETRKLRAQTIGLFSKLSDAVKAVAAAKGISVVVADHHVQPSDLDKITDMQAFNNALLTATILYSDGASDITQDVILQMNKDYASSGAAAPAAAPKKP